MKTITIVASLFILFAFTPANKSNSIVYEGLAIDMETKQLIYREVHNEIHDNTGHIVTQTNFFDANAKLIAKRNLDFTSSKIKPLYSLTDYRNDSYEAVSNEKGFFTISYKENKETETLIKTIEVPEPAVVDGGFNYYVKQEWDKLMAGNTSYFNYISVARQSYYRFQLSKIQNENSIKNNEVVIKMEASNYLLRALLDPIFIKYNTETKRIISYKGISNIKDSSGKNHFATLSYATVGP